MSSPFKLYTIELNFQLRFFSGLSEGGEMLPSEAGLYLTTPDFISQHRILLLPLLQPQQPPDRLPGRTPSG